MGSGRVPGRGCLSIRERKVPREALTLNGVYVPFTDNTLEISGRQLDRAGVIDVFERRFSVDETVRRNKPAPEAYRSVAAALETVRAASA
jgi:beta-phosphoglucomutase-like phosphatase (HAD superfamily)